MMRRRAKIFYSLFGLAIAIPVIILISNWDEISESARTQDLYEPQKLKSDLDRGKITVLQYCDHESSDQEFCNRYKSLHGIK